MTKEEAKEILEEVKDLDDSMYQYISAYEEALDMAIKALSQEPCEDAVSRQTVIDALKEGTNVCDLITRTREMRIDIIDVIKALPSVNPTRAHGKWIQKEYWSEGCGMGETYGYYYECSKCGNLKKGGYDRCGVNYCPNCGAEMR